MHFNKTLLLITLTLFSFLAKAQYDGDLQFIGRNFINNRPLSNTIIKITTGGKTVSEFDTKDRNNFKTKLEFGNVYRAAISYEINRCFLEGSVNLVADVPVGPGALVFSLLEDLSVHLCSSARCPIL